MSIASVEAEAGLNIAAEYAVVVDADTGDVLYNQGMDATVPVASLTKIFTAAVALDSASVDRTLTVDEYDIVGEASMGLTAGEELSLETALYGLMLASGNDAAMTIARDLGGLPGDTPQRSVDRFMDRVNSTADRLGLLDTDLKNPHGLDQAGHVSSARDVAAMSLYALDNPIFREIISTPHHMAEGHEIYQVNRMLSTYPGLIGGKTGITDGAGYSLMQVAERDGRTVLTVLLKSDPDNWYNDAAILLDHGFGVLEQTPTDPSREKVGLPASTEFDVPDVGTSESVGGGFQIDRLSDQEAIVRSADAPADDGGITWTWPVASLVTMVCALAVIVNYPTLLGVGSLAWDRKGAVAAMLSSASTVNVGSSLASRLKRPKRSNRRPVIGRNQQGIVQDYTVSAPAPEPGRFFDESTSGSWAYEPSLPDYSSSWNDGSARFNPAIESAERAIRLAIQGNYHAATNDFVRALSDSPSVDLTACNEFWSMDPMGHMAAAKAYMRLKRRSAAIRLLQNVRAAHRGNYKLDRLFRNAIASIQ